VKNSESMRVGVVVERRRLHNPWQEYSWRPVEVVPGLVPAADWQILCETDDLGRYLAGEKLVARRPNIADKFLKWSRHPHRITEAGILATVVNAVLTVWLLLEIPYVIMDPGHVDGVAVAASAAALITFFSMPLMVIGIFTLRGHHWGPWAGLVLSSVNFLISLLGMFNIVELFGNLYDATPVLRGVMFGLTSTLVGGELLYFAVACLASEKRRKSQRVVTSASTPWNG